METKCNADNFKQLEEIGLTLRKTFSSFHIYFKCSHIFFMFVKDRNALQQLWATAALQNVSQNLSRLRTRRFYIVLLCFGACRNIIKTKPK